MDNANQDVEVPCGNSLKRKIELSQHTKSTMVEVNFTWKIDKFSFKARVMKNVESLKSKFFSADGDKKAQWLLLCYPKGYTTIDDNWFSYYLQYHSGPTPMAIEFTFSIIDITDGSVFIQKVLSHTFTKCPAVYGGDSGTNHFVLQDLLEKYVRKDALTVQCKLTYEENV